MGMYHLRRLIPLISSAVMLSSQLYTSCGGSNEQHYDPAVFPPSTTEITVTYSSSDCIAVFSGFSYSDINDIDRLVVTNDFSLGMATFESTIVNVNRTAQTFSVNLVCHNISVTSIFGNFTFWYDNQKINNGEWVPFRINIVGEPSISYSGPTSQLIHLDEDGNGSCTFTGFQAENILNISTLLDCEHTFSQAGTTIQLIPHFVNQESFDLELIFANAREETLSGTFSFYYNREPIINIPKFDFYVNLISSEFISPPLVTDYKIQLTNYTGTLIIPNFIFGGVKQDEVSVEWTASRSTEMILSCSIINWNEQQHRFDIEINFYTKVDANDISLTFKFLNKTTGQYIPFESDDFFIDVSAIVPDEVFVIDNKDGLQTIIGTDPIILETLWSQDYTTLRIPSNIDQIGEWAFYRNFTTDRCPKLTTLEFPLDSNLKTIGSNAFYDCSSFTCPLVFPNWLTDIDDYAFANASNLTSMSFSNLTQPVTIKDNAFSGDVNMKGDVILPENVTVVGSPFNETSGFDGTLFVPPKINENFSFAGLHNIKNIDLTRYTSKPVWLQKDYSFNTVGSQVPEEITKTVYYSSSLVPFIQEIIADLQAHSLSTDWTFKLKTDKI